MTVNSRLQCIFCSSRYPVDSGVMRCEDPKCSGLLEVAYDLGPYESLSEEFQQVFRQRRMSDKPEDASGVWRFREFVLPHLDKYGLVTHESAEGNTPLLRFPRSAKYAGCIDVRFKHEGYNATGSFKDRGMTAGVSAAKAQGATMFACASTGNTAASMASYAALARRPALILLPEGGVAMGKIAQSLAYGAKVVMIRGNFDQALALLQQAAPKFGLSIMNSLNPLRLEGQKTIMWEMLEQRGWQPPDWVVVPGGNLGNAAAFHKALVEAHKLDWIHKVPRLAIIQASGAAPLARAWPELQENFTAIGEIMRSFDSDEGRSIWEEFRRGQVDYEKVADPQTVASAIRIGSPVNFPKAIRALLQFDAPGACISVSDEAIMEAKIVLDSDGIGAEPSSATALAGLRVLRAQGTIGPVESVVCVLTGHVLKAADHIVQSMDHEEGPTRLPNAPVTIDANIDTLSRIVEKTAKT